MKITHNKSETKILRQKAEELLKKKPLRTTSWLSEADTLKLIHELEVHQVELEIQNKELEMRNNELRLVSYKAKVAAEKHTALYDFAPTGYFSLSNEGNILELNICASQMLGKERSYLRNKLFGFYVSSDTKPIFNLFFEKVFSGKTKETCEAILLTNGSLPLTVHLTGIIAENGEQCHITVIDITERKQAENAIRESAAQFRNLLHDIQSISVQGYGPDGTTQYWNHASELLYGYTAQEAIGKNLMDLVIPPEIRGDVEQAIRQMAETGQPIPSSELLLMRKDGSRVLVFSSHTIVQISGSLPELFCIDIDLTDITERKKTEEELKAKNEELIKLNSEKDKFFSIIAHDLRGPFNSLIGITQLLTDELSTMTQDEIKKSAVTMRKSAIKFYILLENLLEWSMMQRGLISFKPESFILLNGIAPIIELYRDVADKKMIRIGYDVPEDLRVVADKHMFDSLMRNLVFNAVKFTPKGGRITIAAKLLPGNSVEISVKDTGIGMNQSIIDHLFLLDTETPRKGTEDEPSSGLGLIICKDFVEKNDGKIWAESEEGKGSAFYFTLPINKEQL